MAARTQSLEGLPSVAQRLDLQALGPRVVDDQFDDVRVVFDDEGWLHGVIVSISGSAGAETADSSGPVQPESPGLTRAGVRAILVLRVPQMRGSEQTYFQKGFNLKDVRRPDLAASYHRASSTG